MGPTPNARDVDETMVKTKQEVGVTSYIAGQTMGEIDANEHNDDEQEEGLMYSYSDFNTTVFTTIFHGSR
jgi:hypothetical protein